MIDKVNAQQCYLCDACVMACPVSAISKENQVLDLFYPQINLEKCIGCNRCEKVCPSLNFKDDKTVEGEHNALIVWNKDELKRKKSTSGGVFIALAENTLKRGGYVCGAVFDENFNVHHVVSNQTQDIEKMMGSKYVQSDTAGIYDKIENLLKNQVPVLFSGCPCQVAALHSFLGKKYENLFCVEVVCHGISSPYLWQQYLNLRQKIHKGKIKSVAFRSKKNGWHESAVQMFFDNGKEYFEPYYRDAFSGSMVKDITLKESCYQCKFKNFSSGADITLGDFWGANIEVPDLDDNKGLSEVITHTPYAEALLHELDLNIVQGNLQQFVKYNKSIVSSASKSPVREVFYQAAEQIGYGKAIKKYLFEPFGKKSNRILKSYLRRIRKSCILLIKGK